MEPISVHLYMYIHIQVHDIQRHTYEPPDPDLQIILVRFESSKKVTFWNPVKK
jgi:hypothetical protein